MAVGDIHELNELLENAIAIYKMTVVRFANSTFLERARYCLMFGLVDHARELCRVTVRISGLETRARHLAGTTRIRKGNHTGHREENLLLAVHRKHICMSILYYKYATRLFTGSL